MKEEKDKNSKIPTSNDKNYTIFTALYEAMVKKEKKESKFNNFFSKFSKKTVHSNTSTDGLQKRKNEKMILLEESQSLDKKEKELLKKIAFLEKKIMKLTNKIKRKKGFLS